MRILRQILALHAIELDILVCIDCVEESKMIVVRAHPLGVLEVDEDLILFLGLLFGWSDFLLLLLAVTIVIYICHLQLAITLFGDR